MNSQPHYARSGSSQFRLIRRALFLGGFATFSQLYFVQALLPLLAQSFAITPAQSSWAVSASTLSMAAGMLLNGLFADRFDRKRWMVTSLLTSSILTLASALAPNFAILVFISALKGVALSGLSAVAMSYMSEEIEPSQFGRSMGLYITGNILGGLSGRVTASLLADHFSWQIAAALIGLISLLMGLEFYRSLPRSRNFIPRAMQLSDMLDNARLHLSDGRMIGLFMFTFLMMGSFVSVYNYLGFRLISAPFNLPHAAVGAIFMVYVMGMVGSFGAGIAMEKLGREWLLWRLTAMALLGLLLTLLPYVAAIVAGLIVFTATFFAAHTIASSWVSQRAKVGKATATSLYLFAYYVGSSLIGSSSGMVMHAAGWHGLVAMLACAMSISLAISVWLPKKV
ncbi:MFS transporter [Ampullimonas aquatilis]|uniref:MFS transporter n=1 Tax=Ampullimonas aquatilis TaxID=1341549 RepID=UPI003C732187